MNQERDYELIDLPYHLGCSKSKEFREQVIRTQTALIKFLIDNDLLHGIQPFDDDGNLNPKIVIRKSHVTEDGLEMFKKVIPGWWNYLDKGGKVENISRLVKGLEKIRERTAP